MVLLLSKFKRVPLPTLRGVLHATAVHPAATTADVARALGASDQTASKALTVLSGLGLVTENGSSWTCATLSVSRSTTDAELDCIISAALLAYRPFESLCEGLIVGESFDQAARHTAVSFDLDMRAEKNLALLRQWGIELGALIETNGDVSLNASLQDSAQSNAALPVGSMTSTAETRLYVSGLLGRDAFDQLDEVDRTLLADAVRKCDSSPRDSVEASGQALEDYLRELCITKGLSKEASRLNGAGQLAALLRQHNHIHPHHLKLVDAASMLRNAKAHKKDKHTVAPWDISALGARTAFGAATLAIGSIHDWATNGRQRL